MNDDFITKGIENDRYLKAVRLYKQFEEEMVRELRNLSEDTIERRPDLFVDDVTPDRSISRRRTSPLGHMRMDNRLRRVNVDGEHLVLNIGIEWAQPENHGHDDAPNGALCIVMYKIKNLPRTEYERVKQQTKSHPKWETIQFDDDLWNSGWGIHYIPVIDGPEVKQGLQTLQEHFLEFGESYGELPADESI
jgi:hypothetical protein